MDHVAAPALEAGLDDIRMAPSDHGRVQLIVRRPAENEREILDEATLDAAEGLVGDTWLARGSSGTADGHPPLDTQITVMNARVASLVASDADRQCLAGDQLYLDLDISQRNLPPGSRLQLGTAVIEVTGKPHTGCHKFAARFGQDAVRFVNSAEGRELRLRGANARVVVPGVVHTGDVVRKVRD
jgi:MOSC domain-containing protein YiiM